MRRLSIAVILALALTAVGALSVIASGASGSSGCAVNTPRGAVQVPASACDHGPTLSGSTCAVTTQEGRSISPPRQACAYGPRPVDNASLPPPSAPCHLTSQ